MTDLERRIEAALALWPRLTNESRRRALAQQLGAEAWPALFKATGEGWLAELMQGEVPVEVGGGLTLVQAGAVESAGKLTWLAALGKVYDRRATRRNGAGGPERVTPVELPAIMPFRVATPTQRSAAPQSAGYGIVAAGVAFVLVMGLFLLLEAFAVAGR